MTDICNSKDILDSRDVIARIEELQNERDSLVWDVDNAQENYDAWVSDREDSDGETDEEREEGEELATAIKLTQEALAKWDEDEKEELDTLTTFAGELEGYGDWESGEALIRASYFKTYAEELAGDIGAIDPDAGWPSNRIDWDAAADDLLMDYTEADLDGVTYYMRA